MRKTSCISRAAPATKSRAFAPVTGAARSGSDFGDYGAADWPTPELPHRGQQMFIEPILLAQAQSYATSMCGWVRASRPSPSRPTAC